MKIMQIDKKRIISLILVLALVFTSINGYTIKTFASDTESIPADAKKMPETITAGGNYYYAGDDLSKTGISFWISGGTSDNPVKIYINGTVDASTHTNRADGSSALFAIKGGYVEFIGINSAKLINTISNTITTSKSKQTADVNIKVSNIIFDGKNGGSKNLIALAENSNYNKTITMDDVTFQNWNVTTLNGIFSARGIVTLNNCTFKNNTGKTGALLSSTDKDSNDKDKTNVTCNNCTFENNTGTETAGAVKVNGGTVTLNNCTIKNNKSAKGAVYAAVDNALTLKGTTTITGNTDTSGAGNYNICLATDKIMNIASGFTGKAGVKTEDTLADSTERKITTAQSSNYQNAFKNTNLVPDDTDCVMKHSNSNYLYLWKHASHTWNYTAVGNVVTAKCTTDADCRYYSNGVTLTLTTEDATYSGSTYNGAKLTNGISSITGATAGNIYYEGVSPTSYTNTTTAPTTTFTITQKEIGVTWSNTELTYNKAEQKPTAVLNTDELCGEDTCTVTVGGEQTNVGDNYTATATLGNANYKPKDAEKETAYKIVPKPITQDMITLDAANKQYEYTGSDITPVVTVKDGDSVTLAAGEDKDYVMSGTTSAKNFGMHELIVTGKGNYTGEVKVEWKITKKRMSTPNKENYEGTYDGASHSASVSVTDLSDATITYSETENGTYEATSPSYKNAGTYTVYYKIEKEGYEPENGTLTVKINQKAITVKAKDESKTYGDTDPAFTYDVDSSTSLITDDTLSGITVTRLAGEDVGTYTMTATQSSGANPNYNITFNTGTFTIYKGTYGETITKTIYLDAEDSNVTGQTVAVADFFGEAVPTDAKITAVSEKNTTAGVVTNVQADTDNNVVKYDTTSKDKEKDAGNTYTVTISSKNYADISATLQFVVTAKEEVTLSGLKVDDKTYDKEAVAPSGMIVAKKTSDTQVAAIPVADYVYTWEENEGTADSQSWKTLSEAPINAGNYRLTVSVTPGNASYKGSSEYTFTIHKKSVKVNALNQAIYVGDELQTTVNSEKDCAVVSYDGFLDKAEDLINGQAEVSVPTYNKASSGVGDYVITVSNVGTLKTTTLANNYELSAGSSGTLKVVAKKTDHKVYGDTSGNLDSIVVTETNAPVANLKAVDVEDAKNLLAFLDPSNSVEKKAVEEGKNALLYLMFSLQKQSHQATQPTKMSHGLLTTKQWRKWTVTEK